MQYPPTMTSHERFLETVKQLNAWLNPAKPTYDLEQISTISKAIDYKPPKPYKAWIGINPPPNSISLGDIFNKGKELPYKHYMMCAEQHTDGGIRPHLHILALVSKTTRPNKEIARLAKMFNIKESSVEVKITNNEGLNLQREKYILGDKTEDKQEKVLKDKEIRETLGIPQFYQI